MKPAGLYAATNTELNRIHHLMKAGSADMNGSLARLRRENGQPVAESRTTWAWAAAVTGDTGKEPSRADNAFGIVLKLFAIHQRAHRSKRVHSSTGAPFTYAAAQANTSKSHQVRLEALCTSSTLHELTRHLMSLVRQVAASASPVNYARLTSDLVEWQDPQRRRTVAARWMRDTVTAPAKPPMVVADPGTAEPDNVSPSPAAAAA